MAEKDSVDRKRLLMAVVKNSQRFLGKLPRVLLGRWFFTSAWTRHFTVQYIETK